MPYARKFNRKGAKGKSKSKSSPWYSRKFSAYDAGKYALSQIWKLKGLVNSEMFKSDAAFTNTALTTGSVNSLVNIAQGDGDNGRTGNSIFVRSYNLHASIVHNAGGSNTQFVRISVVMDTQQVGDTAPGYTDIYETASPYSHLNSNTVGRFKVLYSHTYTVNNSDKTSCLVNINLPMRHHVRYNGSAGSDIQKGGLYICTSVDEPTANMPTWSGENRLSYHDN